MKPPASLAGPEARWPVHVRTVAPYARVLASDGVARAVVELGGRGARGVIGGNWPAAIGVPGLPL